MTGHRAGHLVPHVLKEMTGPRSRTGGPVMTGYVNGIDDWYKPRMTLSDAIVIGLPCASRAAGYDKLGATVTRSPD